MSLLALLISLAALFIVVAVYVVFLNSKKRYFENQNNELYQKMRDNSFLENEDTQLNQENTLLAQLTDEERQLLEETPAVKNNDDEVRQYLLNRKKGSQ